MGFDDHLINVLLNIGDEFFLNDNDQVALSYYSEATFLFRSTPICFIKTALCQNRMVSSRVKSWTNFFVKIQRVKIGFQLVDFNCFEVCTCRVLIGESDLYTLLVRLSCRLLLYPNSCRFKRSNSCSFGVTFCLINLNLYILSQLIII